MAKETLIALAAQQRGEAVQEREAAPQVVAPAPAPETQASAFGGYQGYVPFTTGTLRQVYESRYSYWERPENIASHYEAILAEPEFDWRSVGVDPDFVRSSYEAMQAANGGKPWWDWQPLTYDDPLAEQLRSAPEPAPEVQWRGVPKFEVEQPQAQTPQLPSGAEFENLTDWQKTMAFLQSNGTLAGISNALPWMVLGAVGGFAVGGPIGGIVGALGAAATGGVMGWLGDQETQEAARKRLLAAGYSERMANTLIGAGNTALRVLNWPAEKLEQALGASVILGEAWLPSLPYRIFGYEDMYDEYIKSQADVKALVDNLPKVWEVSRLAYEAAATTALGGAITRLPAHVESVLDKIRTGQTDVVFTGEGEVYTLFQREPVKLDKYGTALMRAALAEVLRGADPEHVVRKYQEMTGFSGQFADLMYQSLADPLNVLPAVERGAVRLGAKLTHNPVLEMASKMASGEGIVGTYRTYGQLLREGAAGAPSPWEMTRFQRWLADVTPEGIFKELQPGVAGSAVRVKRGLLSFAEMPLNPVGWFRSLGELTPKSKLNMFTRMAQENLGELIRYYDGDVESAVKDITALIDKTPAELRAMGERLGNPEMYTIRQGLAGFAEKNGGLSQRIQTWRRAERARQLIARVSEITGKNYHDIVKELAQGGTREAQSIYTRLVNAVRSAAPDSPLLSDPSFTPALIKDAAAIFRASPWASDPGFFLADLYRAMNDHLEEWAIKAFNVKPDAAWFRASAAAKAVQSLLLLDFNPAYLANNVVNNYVTMAAENVAGFVGPSNIRGYLDWLGSMGQRAKEGIGFAGDTQPARQRYATFEEAYQEGGIEAAIEWSNAEAAGKGAEATRVNDIWTKIKERVPTGPMRAISGKAESTSSVIAHYNGTMQAWARLWRRDGAIPKMPNQLRESLSRIDPRLPDLIISGIESAKTKEQLSRILSGLDQMQRRADPYLAAAVQKLGIDDAATRQMLAQTNLLEKLNGYLDQGLTVDDAINAVSRDVNEMVRQGERERLQSIATQSGAVMRAEGFAGAVNGLRDLAWAHDEFWTRSFAENERAFERANQMGPERRGYLDQHFREQNEAWRSHKDSQRAAMYGYLREAGFTDPAARNQLGINAKRFMGEMTAMDKRWDQFFRERERRVKKFFKDSQGVSDQERARLWLEAQVELGIIYDQYSRMELESVRRMGRVFLEMYREQFGEKGIEGVAYWWQGIYRGSERRIELMRDIRAWERSEPLDSIRDPLLKSVLSEFSPEDRHAAWPKILEKVYLPAIGEITQAHMLGVQAFSDAVTGRPLPPEMAEALRFFEESVDPVEDIRRAVAAVEEQPLKPGEEAPEPQAVEPQAVEAAPIETGQPVPIEQAADTTAAPRTLDDVYVPALKQEGWTRGKKGLLNAVNADRKEQGLEPYAKASDVPWDEAMAALRKRVPQQETPPPPSDLPEHTAKTLPDVTVQKYLTGRVINGIPIVGAAYVKGKFAAYVPYRFEVNKAFNTSEGPARILGIDADGNWVYRMEQSGEIKTLTDGDANVPVAGPFIPGTLESHGGVNPDPAQIWQEGYRMFALPILDEIGRQMRRGAPLSADLNQLSDADVSALRKYIEEVANEMAAVKRTAIRYGDMKRNMALLDYSKRYGLDSWMDMVFPYQFWFTRSMVNWALRIADRPAFLAFFARLANFTNEEIDERYKVIPSRLKQKLRIPIPFLESIAPWSGGAIYVDPWGKLFPFREFLRPWEQYLRGQNNVRRKAEQLLYTWVEDGMLSKDEAQEAIDAMSGEWWDRAMVEAQQQEGGDILDFMQVMSSPSLALSLIVRGPEKVGPLPFTRFLHGMQAVTGWKGLGSLNVEANLRRDAKLSEFGEWGNWYVDRQLSNMAADGLITAEEAQIAMIERSGPAYDAALERVRMEIAMQQPGLLPILAARNALKGDGNLLDILGSMLISWLPGGLLPSGELELRGLKSEYDAAWDAYHAGNKNALDEFFSAHPEYQARLALYDEPQERLQKFLVNTVWDRWSSLPEPIRNSVTDQFGDVFREYFLDGETRDYSAIPIEMLQEWAQALGGYRFEGAPQVAPMEFRGMEAAQLYEQLKEQMFPGISALTSRLYGATPEQQATLKAAHPEIQAYYNWRDTFIAAHPELIPYFIRQDSELAQADPETAYMVYQWRAERARLFPDIGLLLDQYYQMPKDQRKAFGKQNPEIYRYFDWERQTLQQFPQIVRYVKSDQSAFKTMFGEKYVKQYGTPVDVYSWPQELQAQMAAYFQRGVPLGSGAQSYAYGEWQRSGRPFGSFNRWLQSLGVYYGYKP